MEITLKTIREQLDALWEYSYYQAAVKDQYLLDSLESLITDINILIIRDKKEKDNGLSPSS